MNGFKHAAPVLLSIVMACSRSPRIEEGTVEVGDASLYYKTVGSGEPVVVLHGGPGFDHQILMPHIGALADHHKVILYDQRGAGRSRAPVDSASIHIDTFIEDIEAVRKSFGIERMNLSGVSWGGVLALFYAARHPGQVRSLVLFGTAASSDLLYRMYPAMRARRTPEDAERMKKIRESEPYRRNDPEALEAYFRILLKTQLADTSSASEINLTLSERSARNMNRIAELIWASIGGEYDLHDSLAAIRCPTLILHGRKDPLPMEAAERIHSAIPHSDLIVFENSGHWLFMEEKERFRSAVEAFLSEVAKKVRKCG